MNEAERLAKECVNGPTMRMAHLICGPNGQCMCGWDGEKNGTCQDIIVECVRDAINRATAANMTPTPTEQAKHTANEAGRYRTNGFGSIYTPAGIRFEATLGKHAEPIARELADKLNAHQELVGALKAMLEHFVGDRNAQNLIGDGGKAADKARALLSKLAGGAE